ncbi:TPA: metal-dependent hydrolase [Candidatus Woesearchaeota archaeon]|nr:hypothetical protein [archaeon]HIJ11436.1 metal-dependent hydrolase [Candidatus Woesearchaeota archaeon]|tara:strand:+ start:470 stop:967 length:498 start_codon:yes stop_codon:yes gene_type:complete
MALAVTHIIGTILILDLFRHYVFGKKAFPRYLLVVGGVAGILPDIDIIIGKLVSWMSGTTVNLHGVFSHSLFIPVLFVGIGFFLQYNENMDTAKWYYVIAAGWFLHIILDCGFNAYSTFLWPLHIDTMRFCPSKLAGIYRSGIDAILLVVWLVHEEVHNKIKEYF